MTNEMKDQHLVDIRHNFEIKKKIVLSGGSRVFSEWSKHSTITVDDFIDALDWLCDDPLNDRNQCTRDIALSPTGIKRLYRRYYDDTSFAGWVDSADKSVAPHRWEGEIFQQELIDHDKKMWGCDTIPVRRILTITVKEHI